MSNFYVRRIGSFLIYITPGALIVLLSYRAVLSVATFGAGLTGLAAMCAAGVVVLRRVPRA